MMTEPSYSGGGEYASAVIPGSSLSFPPPTAAIDDVTMVPATSLRLVKRPMSAVTVDTCKKRRKQSTPIRISTSNVENAPSDFTNAGNNIGSHCFGGKLGLFLNSPEHPNNSLGASLPTEPDPESAAAPPGEDHLLDPQIKMEPLPDNCEKLQSDSPDTEGSPVNLSGGQNFPPWMSDMQIRSDDWLGASKMPQISGNMNSLFLPVAASSPNVMNVGSGLNACQQIRASGPPPIRIFNPEAYCELCNKEFCNKYFLKTHKANKHRIYSELSSTSSETFGVAVNVPSYTTVKKPIISNTNILDIQQNVTENKVHINTTSDANTSTGFLHSTFCDVCNKGFANKILLKAHIMNLHGIVMNDVTEASLENVEQLVTTPMDDPPPPPPPLLPPTDIEVKDVITNKNIADNDNIYKTELFKDNRLSVISKTTEDENSQNAESAIASLQGLSRDKNNEYTTNRLRRLGIMNPEAFCEICCKEYCNKYFLRTHKMKRHGILIPDDNSKDNQKDFKLELSISNNWYQIQTSPLNLIIGEQNTNSSGSCSDRKASPITENECDVCGMRFQTSQLAQLHAATAHNQFKLEQTNHNMNNDHQESATTSSVVSVNNNEKQGADSISEDLQKLQTMILQLNDLDVSRVSGLNNSVRDTTYSCTMCGKEYDNRYYLHAHLMTEHGMLLDKITEKQPKNENTAPDATTCKLCGQDGFTLDNIHLHTVECTVKFPIISSSASAPVSLTMVTNSLDLKKEESNGFNIPDKTPRSISNSNGNNMERRSSITLTPANSYCEICNKELCNKYFMKTHMQRMHGIEIENGAQIGGVVCNICNKELCSKYFLRVHKHNTHGIVEEGSGGITSRQSNLELDPQASINNEMPNTSDAVALKPADISDMGNRYFSHFTEVCTICNRRFRSTKWLKAHLLGDHGKVGTDKWNELEMQLQQSFTMQQQAMRGKSGTGSDRISPALRIPNGGIDNVKSENEMQNVLHSIFGTDDKNVKQYHCSFCSFSTPVLAFLFVHERSHSQLHHSRQPQSSSDVDAIVTPVPEPPPVPVENFAMKGLSKLNCAVCNKTFQQPDQLHHHIITQHSFMSFTSFFGDGVLNKQQSEQLPQQQSEDNTPGDKQEEKCPKCTQCGRTTGQPNSLSTDLTIVLKELSTQNQLPASYAVPQRNQQLKYTMQAFVMDEPTTEEATGYSKNNLEENSAGESDVPTAVDALTSSTIECEQLKQNSGCRGDASKSSSDRRFAPSIVFLPVLEKLTAPLTVSFTLTPA